MGRLIRISIYALIILILYFWVTTMIKSYQKDSPAVGPVVETPIDTLVADTLTLNDVYEDTDVVTNMDIVDGNLNYKDLDEKVKKLEDTPSAKPTSPKEQPKTTQKPATESKPALKPKPVVIAADDNPSSSGSIVKGDGGSYLVMAGSYLLKENAVKMVNKLKNMGYPQAEVVVFQASEYHSVVAARFSSESKAKSAASELKLKGVDSFVKSK